MSLAWFALRYAALWALAGVACAVLVFAGGNPVADALAVGLHGLARRLGLIF